MRHSKFFVVVDQPWPGRPPEIGDVVQVGQDELLTFDGNHLGLVTKSEVYDFALPASEAEWWNLETGKAAPFKPTKKFITTHIPNLT